MDPPIKSSGDSYARWLCANSRTSYSFHVDKDFILEQIRSLAARSGGRTPGAATFEKETGIPKSVWYGKYWARWSDAVVEAGLAPNAMQTAYDKQFVTEKFISLIRELGKFPTSAEIRMKARSERSFPSHNVFDAHLGSKSERAALIKAYCEHQGGMEDVIRICRPHIEQQPANTDTIGTETTSTGYVYLIKSGKHYKIGSTNNPDRRQYEIGLQLPEAVHHIHSIETDDPSGIEAYWHRRFGKKRLKGEWFDLSASDIKSFRQRKFM